MSLRLEGHALHAQVRVCYTGMWLKRSLGRTLVRGVTGTISKAIGFVGMRMGWEVQWMLCGNRMWHVKYTARFRCKSKEITSRHPIRQQAINARASRQGHHRQKVDR